jgi:hypothetical protein
MDDRSGNMPSNFDRLMGQLDGLPDVTKSQEAVITTVKPLGVGGITTTIIQTYRHRELGDFVFVQTVSDEDPVRFVIPPKGAAAIARQRDSLLKTIQRKHGRRIAAERQARGEQPGFMVNPGKGGRKRAKKGGKKR